MAKKIEYNDAVKKYHNGDWTEAKFVSFIKSILRKASQRWGPKNEAIKRQRVSRGIYKCELCHNDVETTKKVGDKKTKNVIADHIEPVVDPYIGFTNWNDFIERLFIDSDGYQILCSDCHNLIKTAKEKEIAKRRVTLEKQGLSFIGRKFSRLMVVDKTSPSKALHPRVICECDCGNVITVQINNLMSGHTKSCGCFALEAIRTHGLTNTVEYKTWSNIKSRCNNPNTTGYNHYGGRGIFVCDRWLEEEKGFLNFLEDMGERPSDKHSIDRIDNNGGYTPDNCRWVTQKPQSNNKSTNHILFFDGEYFTISEWADKLCIKQNTIYYRIKRGWTIPEAFGFEDRSTKYNGRLTIEEIDWIIKSVDAGATKRSCAEVLNIDESQITRLYYRFKDKKIQKRTKK